MGLVAERERSSWCGLFPKNLYGTRDAAANFGAIVMDTLTNMEFLFFADIAARTSDCFYHGDQLVILADETRSVVVCARTERSIDRDSPWSARWREENHIVESYRAIRADHEWLAILGVEGRPEARGNQHGNNWSERCRSQQDTEFTRHQEKHERSQRDRFE